MGDDAGTGARRVASGRRGTGGRAGGGLERALSTAGKQRGRIGHSLTVELAGIPGAGKSRLTRTLTTALGEAGLAVHRPQERFGPGVPDGHRLARKALTCTVGAARAPGGTLRLVRGLARSGQPGMHDVAGRLVQALLAQALAARAHSWDGVTILDEGLVQALWSTGLRGEVEPVLAALEAAPGASSADLLVVLRVDPELALARLDGRDSRHSRTQALFADEQLAELQRGAKLLERLVAWWADRSDGEVVVIDGPEGAGDDRQRLVERIRARVEG